MNEESIILKENLLLQIERGLLSLEEAKLIYMRYQVRQITQVGEEAYYNLRIENESILPPLGPKLKRKYKKRTPKAKLPTVINDERNLNI